MTRGDEVTDIIVHIVPVVAMLAKRTQQRINTSVRVCTTVKRLEYVIMLCGYATRRWGWKWTDIKNRKAIIRNTINDVEWGVRLTSDASLPLLAWRRIPLALMRENGGR
jgi:hypothetical protein